MRIVLAGETFQPDINGAAVFARRLAVGLAQRNHELHIIVPSPAGYSYQEEQDGIRIYRIPSFRYPWHPSFYIADLRRAPHSILQIIRDINPDIVHIQAHLIVGRYAARACSELRIPWIATNHFMPENLRGHSPFPIPESLYQILARLAWRDLGRVLRQASAVTAPTRYAAQLLKSRAGIQDAIAISCGVDSGSYRSGSFRSVAEDSIDTPTILFVGRLDADKHVDDLIEAVAHISCPVELRIVGVGSRENALRRVMVRHHLSERVKFLGYLSDCELRNEYNRATVFCMPGSAELQSIATLEAMAAGLPVVAADAHALTELISPGVNGELFRPGDVRSLASALMRVLANEEMIKTSGPVNQALVSRHHDISQTVESFEQLYLKVVNRV